MTLAPLLRFAAYRATPGGPLRAIEQSEQLFGRPVQPAEWDDLVYAPDRAAVAARRAAQPLAAGEERLLTYRLDRGDRPLWVVDRARGVEAGGETLEEGVLLDQSDAALAQARAEREALCRALAGLAGGLAHEVNNPLSGVLNYLQLAERLAGDDAHPRLREALAGALVEGRRVLSLSRSLSQVAARSEGAGALPLPVHDLVRSCLAYKRRALREAFVRLEVEVPEQLPPVRGRGPALALALLAAFDNAFDALSERFARSDPAKRLAVRGALEDDRVRLEIEDGGGGPPAEVAGQVFEPFAGTRPLRQGLGLTLARRALAELEGEVELTETGEGALLTLRLPIG